jgi:hypothetical protein
MEQGKDNEDSPGRIRRKPVGVYNGRRKIAKGAQKKSLLYLQFFSQLTPD